MHWFWNGTKKWQLTTTWITSASWTLAFNFPNTNDSPPDLTNVENLLKLVLEDVLLLSALPIELTSPVFKGTYFPKLLNLFQNKSRDIQRKICNEIKCFQEKREVFDLRLKFRSSYSELTWSTMPHMWCHTHIFLQIRVKNLAEWLKYFFWYKVE